MPQREPPRAAPLFLLRGGRMLSSAFLFVVLVLIVDGFAPAFAQRQPGALGAGLQVGRPGGLAVKWYRSSPAAYDGVFSTDGEDFVVGHVHHRRRGFRRRSRAPALGASHSRFAPAPLRGPRRTGRSVSACPIAAPPPRPERGSWTQFLRRTVRGLLACDARPPLLAQYPHRDQRQRRPSVLPPVSLTPGPSPCCSIVFSSPAPTDCSGRP